MYSQSAKDVPSSIEAWNSKKADTVALLKLLQTYKDMGDSKNEVRQRILSIVNEPMGRLSGRNDRPLAFCPQPFLKFHNPRTFEDMAAAVPNFRAMTLKAGDVPKFFDGVLSRRADDSIEQVRSGALVHPLQPHVGAPAFDNGRWDWEEASEHVAAAMRPCGAADSVHAWGMHAVMSACPMTLAEEQVVG